MAFPTTLLTIDRASATPVFLQLSDQLARHIQAGTLVAGQRLPGSRQLAAQLGLHRQTVVAAYEEGLAQGWLMSRAGSGTFVAGPIDRHRPQGLGPMLPRPDPARQPGYVLTTRPHLTRPVLSSPGGLRLDDGFPDVRLAPVDALSRAYRSYFRWGNPQHHFGYGDTKGHPLLREQLARHLNETRGLRATAEQVLITRGSIMGMHLSCQVLLRPGDGVVVGDTHWAGATMNARQAGATVVSIPVDQHGLDVAALAEYCAHSPVRLVCVTPHHHYPTTVTLRPDRRLQLLQLAEQYGFAILEDDYDYDFHYLSRPILPLASADRAGMVVYVGSLTKSIAPAFRIGYVVGPADLIDELARLRRIIDRQGDPMLEFAVAQLLKSGDLARHFRKALRTYAARRDQFCTLLGAALPSVVEFQKPAGGLAVWAMFDPALDMEALAERAGRAGLFMASGIGHNPPGQRLNGTRLGFASSNEAELEQAVAILRRSVG